LIAVVAGSHFQVITEWNGVKVGLFAVIEDGWMATLCTDISSFQYTPYITVATEICKRFREQDVQLILCLTHMRYRRFFFFFFYFLLSFFLSFPFFFVFVGKVLQFLCSFLEITRGHESSEECSGY
jgi:hypothetical protein